MNKPVSECRGMSFYQNQIMLKDMLLKSNSELIIIDPKIELLKNLKVVHEEGVDKKL